MAGTHVGIIGNVAVPSPAVAVGIRQALAKISDARPFPPLVLHHGHRQGSDDVACDYARSVGNWRIENHPGGNADIATACHILIVIAPGKEGGQAPQPPDIWSLVKRARASGRAIIHIPIVVQSPKLVPKSAVTKQKKPFQPPKNSLAWALSKGRDDRKSGKASPEYTHFCKAYGLPDSPQSLKLWLAYKRAAGVPSQPQKSTVAVSPPRTSGKRTVKTRRIRIPPAPGLRSCPDPMGAVPLTTHTVALLRKLNPPDPDVWPEFGHFVSA